MVYPGTMQWLNHCSCVPIHSLAEESFLAVAVHRHTSLTGDAKTNARPLSMMGVIVTGIWFWCRSSMEMTMTSMCSYVFRVQVEEKHIIEPEGV